MASAVDPGRVDLSSRNVSLCRIADNDRKFMSRQSHELNYTMTLYSFL